MLFGKSGKFWTHDLQLLLKSQFCFFVKKSTINNRRWYCARFRIHLFLIIFFFLDFAILSVFSTKMIILIIRQFNHVNQLWVTLSDPINRASLIVKLLHFLVLVQHDVLITFNNQLFLLESHRIFIQSQLDRSVNLKPKNGTTTAFNER